MTNEEVNNPLTREIRARFEERYTKSGIGKHVEPHSRKLLRLDCGMCGRSNATLDRDGLCPACAEQVRSWPEPYDTPMQWLRARYSEVVHGYPQEPRMMARFVAPGLTDDMLRYSTTVTRRYDDTGNEIFPPITTKRDRDITELDELRCFVERVTAGKVNADELAEVR